MKQFFLLSHNAFVASFKFRLSFIILFTCEFPFISYHKCVVRIKVYDQIIALIEGFFTYIYFLQIKFYQYNAPQRRWCLFGTSRVYGCHLQNTFRTCTQGYNLLNKQQFKKNPILLRNFVCFIKKYMYKYINMRIVTSTKKNHDIIVTKVIFLLKQQ